MSEAIVQPKFNLLDAERARDEWGANCGPAALALVAGLTLDQVRPYMGDFEQKGYTNPALMFESLERLGLFRQCKRGVQEWPKFGLARIQLEGPWMRPNVPVRARYRHTHWVATQRLGFWDQGIFDVNCLNNGSGWVSLRDWSEIVVPWLVKECEPKADGKWHITHAIEVQRNGA